MSMSQSRESSPVRAPQTDPSTPRRESPLQRETQSFQALRTPGFLAGLSPQKYSHTEPRNRQPLSRHAVRDGAYLSPTASQRIVGGDLANISLQLRQRSGDLSGVMESPGSAINDNIYSPASDRGNNDVPYTLSPSAKPPQIPRDLSPQLEAPEPRLVLSKLVLENFKSYAGRQEIGPFNASFSAVVGPNGSGKSNVIDSLLFVFGFRANKMRHGKLTNLIHKSETFPNLQSCRVEVHFEHVLDRPGVGIPFRIANSELVVARNVSFASGSTYDVNGKRSSYGEVTTLLKDKGIDLEHKRFLILQGEVESIAMMKPKAEAGGEDGLLEYLEDIIGTSKFKPMIEDAEEQVEGLREGLIEVQSRYDISVKSLEALEERRVEIEKFMQNSNEIILRQFHLLQHKQYKLKIQQHKEQNEVAVLQAKLDQELARNKAAREQLTALEAEIREKSKDLKAASQTLDQARKAAKAYKVETAQLEEKVGQLASRSNKLEGTISSAERELSMAETWLNNYDEDNAALAVKIEETSKKLEMECQKLAVIQASLKEKTAEVSSQIEALQFKAEPWRSQIQGLETELKRVDADVEHINKTRSEDKARYDAIISRAKAVAETGNLEDKALKKLVSAQKQTDQQLATIEPELALAMKKQALAQQKAESQRSSVMAARESRNSSQNQSRLLTELMKLRDKGEIKGLYGRLGSLGSIDPKYDIAVSTAAPGLDDLVVDTVATGQRCIQILRERNLGRAKFILLDKLSRQNTSPIQTPENVPRLFDLIKPRDPKFAPAFYSVLQNTLVATSMEQARRVAYGQRRYRTVTLEGAIVETSGAMSGGGRAASGRMAARSVEAVSLDELTTLEKASAAADMELAEATQSIERLQQQLRTLNEQKHKLATDIMKQNMTVDECEAQLKELKSQRNDLKALITSKAESDEKILKEAVSKRSDLELSRTKLVEQSAPVEAQLEKLQQQVLDAGGLELRIQQSQVSDLRTQAETLGERQESSVRQKKASIQKVKKLEMSLTESRTELQSVATQLVEQKALLEGRAAQTRQLEDAEEEAYSSFASIQSFLDDAKDNLAGLQTANEESLSATKEYERSLKDSQAKLAEMFAKMETIGNELNTLELYDVREARDLRKDNHTEAHASQTGNDRDAGGVDEAMEDTEPNEGEDEDMDDDQMQVDGDVETENLHQLKPLDSQELERLNVTKVQEEIKLFEERISNVNFNMDDLAEYRAKYAEYSTRVAALNTAMGEFEAKKKVVVSLKQQRLEDFSTGFDIITRKLKQMYKMITLTGNADLELVDSLDPFSEGISFSVMPPGKSWKNISNLSGGEKTLSSLALVFALHHYRPTPLYFMDEIDAALDFRNVSIIANYIKERTTKGQFVVISLRNNMFELADRLVGIYKVNSMTRSVTLDLLAESEQVVTLDQDGEVEPEKSFLSSPPKMASLS